MTHSGSTGEMLQYKRACHTYKHFKAGLREPGSLQAILEMLQGPAPKHCESLYKFETTANHAANAFHSAACPLPCKNVVAKAHLQFEWGKGAVKIPARLCRSLSRQASSTRSASLLSVSHFDGLRCLHLRSFSRSCS